MKPAHLTLLALPLAIALCLAGCTVPASGPAPLPSVVCTLRCADPATTLTYGSVLELRLVDLTRPDQRPQVIAERIESNPGQPPLHYTLLYNAAAIDQRRDYGVEARILFKGRPIWVQSEPLPVVTKEHPSAVEIVLQPAS